ncbi:MAG: metallophosphoesterase [Desulfuromonadales bacterium]|nr:metallophosphoesterase [Desulfuromonadales bacterium]
MSTERRDNLIRNPMTRRRFLTLALASAPSIALANSVAQEATRLGVSRFDFHGPVSPCKLVHISDLHHRGEIGFTERILKAIQRENPDFVCFSGDLIETSAQLSGALETIRAIGFPVFGIPGNHDHTRSPTFHRHQRAFAATGGAWLMNQSVLTQDKSTEIVGLDGFYSRKLPPLRTTRRIVLTHFPTVADGLSGATSSLILAGHSHGGQIRIPCIGPLYLPDGVGSYVHGLFKTSAGPLHVSAGLGTSTVQARFNCPPELTVITL